jgi:AraC-like DNA-binding protein
MKAGTEKRAVRVRSVGTWPNVGSSESRLDGPSPGEITILRLAAREGGVHGSRAESLSAPKGCAMFVVLTRGDCAFKGPDERLKPMRRQEVVVVDSGARLALSPQPGARLAGLTVPAHLIAPRFVDHERLAAASLKSHGLGMASLLYDLLGRLGGRETPTPGFGALVDAVGGLLSATLEDCAPLEKPARGESGHARLDQINRYLRRHFADPELSASDAAGAIGVSRRYLHRLYAQHSRSFREELIALRIEACLSAFQDESQAAKTIAEIAFAAGYTDISQFNRHFRRIKGATPSEMRRAAAGPKTEIQPPRMGRAA